MIQERLRLNQTDKLIFVLTVFLLSCFLIFEKYSWGKYAFLLASCTIFLLDTLSQPKHFLVPIEKIHICFASFVFFCFLSTFWALSRSNALEWSISLLGNLIFIILIYPYFSRKKDISMLLSIIKWASYIIAIYTIWYYGLNTLFVSSYTQYIRLGNDFSNINTVGMFCAFGLLIQIESMMSEKRSGWDVVFTIPALIVVAATQSRKAVFMLVLGIIMIAFLRNTNRRNLIKSIRNYILIALSVFLIIYLLSKISIFSGVTERIFQLLSIVTGDVQLDSGTINRQNYINLGISTWLQYPIGGVGVNCPRIINQRVFGEYVYLHNNYVELLCGVGIIGFLLYYYMYYYIIKLLVRFKNNNRRYYIIGMVWVFLLLVMDYGMVSYYSKVQCFYLMVLFLNIRCISKNMKCEQLLQ